VTTPVQLLSIRTSAAASQPVFVQGDDGLTTTLQVVSGDTLYYAASRPLGNNPASWTADGSVISGASESLFSSQWVWAGASSSSSGGWCQIAVSSGPVVVTASTAVPSYAQHSPKVRNMVQAPAAPAGTLTSLTVTPTLGSAAGATTLAGSSLVAYTDSRFRYEGAVIVPKASAPQYGQAQILLLDNNGPTPPSGGQQPLRVAFDFDGQAFEIMGFSQNNGQLYRVWVNEVPVTADLAVLGATDGTARLLKIDLGARPPAGEPYRIVIESELSLFFGGIRVLPTDTLMAPRTRSPVRFAVVGDSMAQGTGATRYSTGYVPLLGRLLGWPNTASLGQGGTGFYAANSGQHAFAYTGRLYDLQQFSPDVILFQGSVNDNVAGAVGNTQAAIVNYLGTVRSTFPNAKIFLTSQLQVAQDTGATALAVQAEYVAAAAVMPWLAGFKDHGPGTTTRWFSGTGKVGATVGDGNNDTMRAADGVHPTQIAHEIIARRYARWIADALGIDF
jgi:lysophospholipase L1-like esterase